MMKNIKIAFSIALSMAFAVSAFAGGFSPRTIARDAQWVAYANMEQARNTRLGDFMMGEIDKEKAQSKNGTANAIKNLDIRKDVASVTLYGSAFGNREGVMLAIGNFDRNKILDLLEEKDSYAKVQKNGTVIHSWIRHHSKNKNGEKRSFGAFAIDGTIVVSESMDSVLKALKVIDGREPSLETNSILNLANQGRAAFMAAAINMEGNSKVPPKAAILRQSRNLVFSVKERAGSLRTKMVLDTKDEETAFNVENIARGMIAIFVLQKQDCPGIADLVREIDVVTEGTRVAIDFAFPVDKLIDIYYSKKKNVI